MRRATLWSVLAVVAASTALAASATVQQDDVLEPATVRDVLDGDTVEAVWKDGERETFRYAGVSAPEPDACFGSETTSANEALVLQQTVSMETDPQDGGVRSDRDGRVLAYVWLDAERNDLVQAALVRDGFARLDPGPDVSDQAVRDNSSFFPVRYVDRLIEAQLAAATDRSGWWDECDPYRDSDLVVAAVKYWGDEEVVHVGNRGETPINLGAGWRLRDSTDSERNALLFNEIVGTDCPLPSGGLLRIHSGHAVPEDRRETYTSCGQQELDIYWTGLKIWNNDYTNGDRARLFDPDGELVYERAYPPGE